MRGRPRTINRRRVALWMLSKWNFIGKDLASCFKVANGPEVAWSVAEEAGIQLRSRAGRKGGFEVSHIFNRHRLEYTLRQDRK